MRRSRVHRPLIRVLLAVGTLIALLMIAAVVFSLCSPPIELLFRPTPEANRHPVQATGIPNYTRDEVDTFYTYPEWYIVWSYQAKADFQHAYLPSGYSHFGDIGQFWQAYSRMYAATRQAYPFAAGDHIMLVVIGSSFSVEYALKGAYEDTVGRASEWTSGHQMVAEDEYAAKVAENYAAFVHVRPFYEFSFGQALRGLWSETPFRKTHLVRTLERRLWLSLDYAVESLYCELIELATHATYGYEDAKTAAWIKFPRTAKAQVLALVKSMKLAKDLEPTQGFIEIPRYQEFTTDVLTLVNHGVRFPQIAGNELIVISAIAPSRWTISEANVQLLLKQPILTAQGRTRAVLLARVSDLNEVLPSLQRQGLKVEHLYDY
jgi:hypothetical protein